MRIGHVIKRPEDASEPDAGSAEIMAWVDGQESHVRALVYEYGFAICSDPDMGIDEKPPYEAYSDLERWRERRQAQLLAIEFHLPAEPFLRSIRRLGLRRRRAKRGAANRGQASY